ncbi:ribonuclease P protein component [Acidovorax sp. GBBC 3334]|uniref:ribonuclease P protein component n=1 Tax=Acidovorax sp. GBBC 3334 TaxID=2940496 RepID=UPI002304653B|nr:ribonuclease P protein component [Acidovorax sp. GBBC 3334]MDA8454981.1 ribonuclease P protein component [Acidovorax sp. GBBC 3334]
MQRLKTRPQFQAAMAGGTISRTPHFALHRLRLDAAPADPASGTALPAPAPSNASPAPGPGALPSWQGPQALFAMGSGIAGDPWLGAMVPKRWARRAVTRNAIKRQIYAVAPAFGPQLGAAAHVVRLRAGFDRKQFPSAVSEALKQAVRAELLQLFAQAVRKPGKAQAPARPLAAPAADVPVQPLSGTARP